MTTSVAEPKVEETSAPEPVTAVEETSAPEPVTVLKREKLVTMRFQSKTLQRVERLRNPLGVTNRTQLVAYALELLDYLVHEISKGGKVTIEHPDGTREVIKFVGL